MTLWSGWRLAEIYLPVLSVKASWPRTGFLYISSKVGCVAPWPSAESLVSVALVCLWESEGSKKGDACAGHCVLCKCRYQYRNLSLMLLHLCASGKQVNFSNIVIKAVGIFQASSPEMARHLWLWLKFWVFGVGLQINKSIGLKLTHNWVGFKGILVFFVADRVFWECIFSLCPATVLCLCSAEIGDAGWALWKVFQSTHCLCCPLIAINNLPCHSSLLCVFHLQFCTVESCFFCTQM